MQYTMLPEPVKVGDTEIQSLEGLVSLANYYYDSRRAMLNIKNLANINTRKTEELSAEVSKLRKELDSANRTILKRNFRISQLGEKIKRLSNQQQVKTVEYNPSDGLKAAIDFLSNREKVGYQKYGTTVDREDYKPIEWLEHLREELGDALMYSTTLKLRLDQRMREIEEKRKNELINDHKYFEERWKEELSEYVLKNIGKKDTIVPIHYNPETPPECTKGERVPST